MRGVLFIIIGFFICFLSCKTGGKQIEEVISDKIEIDSVLTLIEEDCPIINKEDLIFEDFRKRLEKETEKWSTNLTLDTLEGEQHSFLDLNKKTNVVLSKHYRLKDKSNAHLSVLFDYYRFSTEKEAQDIIENYCDAYYNAVRKGGGEDIPFLLEYTKIPRFVFRKKNTVFVIESTNGIKHISYKAIARFNEQNNIGGDDVIPCEREYIQPVIASQIKSPMQDWLEFYNIDIRQFRFQSRSSPIFSEQVNENTSPYYQEYTDDDKVYLPMVRDYSPDKRYHINLMESAGTYLDSQRGWVYEGGDDCQEIYLADHKQSKMSLIVWLGSGSFIEGAFWIGNASLVLVGTDFSGCYTMKVFDFTKDTEESYFMPCKEMKADSYFIHNLKSRGIKYID